MKKVKINREIYSKESIEQTMRAFKNHAIMSVTYNKEYATIHFIKCKYDETQTINEFENYMIGVENS